MPHGLHQVGEPPSADRGWPPASAPAPAAAALAAAA